MGIAANKLYLIYRDVKLLFALSPEILLRIAIHHKTSSPWTQPITLGRYDGFGHGLDQDRPARSPKPQAGSGTN